MARRKPAVGNGTRSGRAAAESMEELRRRIDAIDQNLVRMLNERAGHAIALGRIKKASGLSIYQPAREQEVLANVQSGNGGPLEDAALRRLFERIIDESRRIERLGTGSPSGEGGADDATGGVDGSSE